MPKTKVAVSALTAEQLKGDAQVAVYSPRRVVPFLVLPDGTSIVESAAILLHFLETFDTTHKLHPAPGHVDRPRFLQGVVFGVAEGYKTVMSVFLLCMNIKKEDRDQTNLVPAKKKFEDVFLKHLIQQLEGREYYLGDQFSAADIVLGYILMTAEYVEEGLTEDPVVKAYHARLKARTTYQKLFMPC